MELGLSQLQLVIVAVKDSIRVTKEQIDREKGDVTDLESHLILLGNLDGDLKEAYVKLAAARPGTIPYEVLVGDRKFRRL